MVNGIKTENIKPMIRERVKKFTEKLKGCPEVEGIVYLGGLANTEYKDFIDQYSDIDIGIFLNTDKENLPDWLQPFSFYIPVNDGNEERMMEVNLHQQIFDEEKRNDWADTKKEAYAYASEVVFDRNGQIEKLIKDKTKLTEEYKKKYLSHLLSRINWNVKINPLRAIERGLILNGEELLNQGIENMTDLLFVYNGKYPPHAKWKAAMIENLEYYPEDITEKIKECYKLESISKEDIIRRRESILSIVKDIEERINQEKIFEAEEDYSEYEYRNWKPKKQLKEKTKYDRVLDDMQGFSKEDKKILKGLMCEYLLTDLESIYDIPREELSSKYVELLDKVTYYDPKTRACIKEFASAKKDNDVEKMEMCIKQLRKRGIDIISDNDGKVDIKKVEYSKERNGEIEHELD